MSAWRGGSSEQIEQGGGRISARRGGSRGTRVAGAKCSRRYPRRACLAYVPVTTSIFWGSSPSIA